MSPSRSEGRTPGAGRTSSGEEPLRVIIADDDPLARRVVRDALQGEGFSVPADAGNGREAVELVLHYRPDLVLMDLVMPEIDGIAATRLIREQAPEVKIVILSMSDDPELGMLGLRTGADGYLTKDLDVSTLPQLLRGVAAGEAAVSRRFTAMLIQELRRTPSSGLGMRPVRSELTTREWEVLDLLAAGLTPDRIADELVLSVETVRSHEKRLRAKLGVHSRRDLIAAVQRLRRPASALDGDHGSARG
jgi:two-component system, NarL family, response regulator LiaR